MIFYQLSWLILFAPLFSFAVIIFGTRVWDMLSRPRVSAAEAHSGDAHAEAHEVEAKGSEGDDHGEHGLDDDEDPKLAHRTMGALVSGYVGIVITALACLYSWLLLLNTAGVIAIAPPLQPGGITVFSYEWFVQGTINYVISFQLDKLAIVMMVVVTTISLLVQFYSQGYMENSAGYARFFAYLTLFTFSMLDIVFAQNFLVMFVGWELVGLSSYLLIGFWINKQAKPAEDRLQPASAAIEAFIVNRIGDVGFIIGIMILFVNTGTFQFSQLAIRVQSMDKGLLTLAMILVFCGAIGKSAQFPLHVWLPPAMEGPTPVSALIHAATLVAACVYMLVRVAFIIQASQTVLLVAAWIGTITAVMAALIATPQNDIKRILAYSKLSQLGYMVMAVGLASNDAAMFHL